MSEEEIIKRVVEKFGEKVIEARVFGKRRISIQVSPDVYRDVVKYVVHDLSLEFLSCLSGVDRGDSLEVVAHLGFSTHVLIRTRVPKNNPIVDSLTDILPAASFYERETHDLLGIIFRGHPNLRRVFLPEDWPEGVYPLRRDYAPEHPKPLRGGEAE